ncbi:IPExxxVDY family protein [Elizabethkingia sp. JS20170427COW]|uniref:IPExxxVDY family protein n=1 Tax=Elizabethkingia sp. JS20170427COW TaxID=2583851 RepID=UPI001110508D|nr:IPExxxVDY family protein [Elizabethkingia sp. JS20170427COW]QCX53366.1 IPExxxVDY family protein [Elizabethkingia sp. JS20170427COW]
MAKTKKIRLDLDCDEAMTIGLVRQAKAQPYYQFFFEINKLNSFTFKRVEDFTIRYKGTNFSFLCMQSYDHNEKSCYQIIANKSFETQESTSSELFDTSVKVHYLLGNQKEVDFLIKIEDSFPDFSLILFPGNSIFAIQEYEIQPEELIYQYIQENE